MIQCVNVEALCQPARIRTYLSWIVWKAKYELVDLVGLQSVEEDIFRVFDPKMFQVFQLSTSSNFCYSDPDWAKCSDPDPESIHNIGAGNV